MHANLLAGRRVARLVHGRGPVPYDELAGIVATSLGLSVGMAEAAIRRAVDASHVQLLVTLPPPAPVDDGPDVDAALDGLAEQADRLARARGQARDGDAADAA
jgi:hypothetical protein